MNLSIPCGLSTCFFTIVLCLIGIGISHAQDTDEEIIIYVNQAKEENNKIYKLHTYGTSWDTAFRHLHDALRFGDPNATQIRMAEGNYYVDWGANLQYLGFGSPTEVVGVQHLNPFFIINRDISIYGGFAGTESSLAERTDPHAHPTYLDGNVYYREGDAFPIPHPENLYHEDNHFAKRLMSIFNSTVTLDGLVFQYVRGDTTSGRSFTLSHGEPNGGHGAFIDAIRSDLTINNCVFQYGMKSRLGLLVYMREPLGESLQITNTVF